MVALVIEVRPDFVTKKLTMNGVEYEESWYNDECKNPIIHLTIPHHLLNPMFT